MEGLGGSGPGRVKATSQSTAENRGNGLCNNQLQQSKKARRDWALSKRSQELRARKSGKPDGRIEATGCMD